MYQRICPVCEQPFECKYQNRVYCSDACYRKALYHRNKAKRYEYFGDAKNREDVLKRDGYQCTMCGATTDLVIHHKDGSGATDNPNNDMTNLVTLCAKCHSTLHHPGQSIYVLCPICGKDFKTISSRIKDGKGKYCSKECADVGRGKNKDAQGKPISSKIPCTCLICGAHFTEVISRINEGRGKHCSSECSKQARENKRNKS